MYFGYLRNAKDQGIKKYANSDEMHFDMRMMTQCFFSFDRKKSPEIVMALLYHPKIESE